MRKRRITASLMLAIGFCSLAAAGCYERVVSAKGPGATGYQVQGAYREDNKIDNWFWKADNK